MQSPVSFLGVWEITVGIFCSPLGRRTLLGYWLKASQVMHHFVPFFTESFLLYLPWLASVFLLPGSVHALLVLL